MSNDRLERSDTVVILRPTRRLLRSGLTVPIALTLPIMAVAFWITVPIGNWWTVLVAELLVVIVSALLAMAFLRTRIELGPDGARERGFFGGRSAARREDVGEILVVDLFRPSSNETAPNMFVVSHDGALLMRMRGQYWTPSDMDAVAKRLGVKPTQMPGPVSTAELAHTSPQLLYRFERFAR